MTKVSVSFVANLSDLPALFSALGPSLGLCEDFKVETIPDIPITSAIRPQIELVKLANDPGNLAPGSTAPKAPGFTRERPAKNPGKRVNRLSEQDYRHSRVQTLIYNRLVEAGYNTPVPYSVLEQVLVDNNYAPKSMGPALTMLYKQHRVDRMGKTAWAIRPVNQRPKSSDEPELPLGAKSDG